MKNFINRWTGGIGKSIAKDFNANGYFVIIMGRNKEKFDEIDFENPEQTDFFRCDLSIKEQISVCLEKIIKPPANRNFNK